MEDVFLLTTKKVFNLWLHFIKYFTRCDANECIKLSTIGYLCQCDRGFVLNVARSSCVDEDECRSGINCRGGRCLNTIGSFQCECPQGSQPSFDRKVFYL